MPASQAQSLQQMCMYVINLSKKYQFPQFSTNFTRQIFQNSAKFQLNSFYFSEQKYISQSNFFDNQEGMKEQKSQMNQGQQAVIEQVQMLQVQKKVEHPPQQYTINEIYSIRKQSSNIANDHIYKKLTKSFHRIKKIRAEPNASALISKQFDYENNQIRSTFKKCHDLYNNCTKTNLIVKKKIDKMRNKVDRIKSQVQNSQLFLVSDVDINKIYSRNTQTPTQPAIPQKQKSK